MESELESPSPTSRLLFAVARRSVSLVALLESLPLAKTRKSRSNHARRIEGCLRAQRTTVQEGLRVKGANDPPPSKVRKRAYEGANDGRRFVQTKT